MTQEPLFPLPAGVLPPAPKHRKPSTVRYTRHRPARRVLCDLCVRDIHARGVAVAPYPMPARWRRVDADNEATLLCENHCRATRGEDK